MNCHLERSSRTFSDALYFGASGRVVEGPQLQMDRDWESKEFSDELR
jgi:hypothetical protein